MTHINLRRRGDGFTVIELMVTVLIVAILLAVGVPTMRDMVANSRANAVSNEFIAALNFTRSEAVKRRASITMCTSDTTSATPVCRAGGDANQANWHRGWIIQIAANNILRQSSALDGNLTLSGPASVVYQSSGAAAAGTFQLRIPNCTNANNRDITIGITGRVGVQRVAC